MKLLVADALDSEALHLLSQIPGLEVVVEPAVKKDELPSKLDGVHVLVVRSKEVSRAAIEAGKALALVVRAGAGVNTIDVAAASERGVYVANCPGKNAIAVAELAIGMLLAIDRRLPEATASLRAGDWKKAEFGKAEGVHGKRLGIAGLGAIGREVATRGKALGMRVTAWSRSLTDARAKELGVERAETLVALARASDVLSIHLPLTKETRGAIDAGVLSALPPKAIVLNTARAEVLDYAALSDAVAAKGLRVGLDVFPGEPEGGNAKFESALVQLPGLVATPHVGASTGQAQRAIAEETARIVRAFVETGDVPNCVNVAARSPARCQLVIRHYDRVGVLAAVLGVIKQHGINVEEMANTPFEGHRASVAKIRLAEFPSAECVREIEKSTPDILHVEAIAV